MLDIDFITMESEMNVCDSIYNTLDKIDYMMEYNASDEYIDDLVMEAFEIYLEATNRRKKADEIDQYIRDKKYGDANASTPHKAKNAKQLRNFLIQHDFDPKTETIKSDVLGKRINFYMPRKDDDGHYNKYDEKITVSPDNITKQMTNAQQMLAHERGHHVFGNTTPSGKPLPFIRDPEDSTGKKLVLDKNGNPIRDMSKSKHNNWIDPDIPENKNERGIKHLDEAKASGKNINRHDDGSYTILDVDKQSPEELEADLYAAKTARVRTKYAGRKRAVKRSGATRNVNDNEIRKYFEGISKDIDKMIADMRYTDEKKSIESSNSNYYSFKTQKNLKEAIKFIKNIDDISDLGDYEIDKLRKHISELVICLNEIDHVSLTIATKYRMISFHRNSLAKAKKSILELDRDLHSKKLSESYLRSTLKGAYSASMLESERDFENFNKQVRQHYVDDLQYHIKKLSEAIKDYESALSDLDSYQSIPVDKKLISELGVLEDILGDYKVSRDEEQRRSANRYRDTKDFRHTSVTLGNKEKSILMFDKGSGKAKARRTQKLFDVDEKAATINEKFAYIKRNISKLEKYTLNGQLEEARLKYIKSLQALKKACMDDSTQMRYDFVKKYVHEFFEDYYSLENFEIYLEG